MNGYDLNIILFDIPAIRDRLQPFSAIRPLGSMLIGIDTIVEKWKKYLPGQYSFATASYLAQKFPTKVEENNLCINGSILPDSALIKAIRNLPPEGILLQDETILAFWADKVLAQGLYPVSLKAMASNRVSIDYNAYVYGLSTKWDFFRYNAHAIEEDFHSFTNNRTSATIHDPYTRFYNPEAIFLEEGVNSKAAVLNAEQGSIYIGPGAVIEEQAVIKGPVAIGEGAYIKAHSYIYGGTTIGAYSKVGGEVSNSVVFPYSNKAHGGFLGNAVVGSWCNIGAYSTASNLRNDYDYIKVWDMVARELVQTDLQFCGLFLGDYSKCGIHTMFNTATVVGLATNLFGTGFFNRFVSSFVKGSPATRWALQEQEKLLDGIERTMARRSYEFSTEDKAVFSYLYQQVSK